jgi:serine protease Do
MDAKRRIWILVAAAAACRPVTVQPLPPTSETFHAAVEAVLPAVVHIQVEASPGWWDGMPPGWGEPGQTQLPPGLNPGQSVPPPGLPLPEPDLPLPPGLRPPGPELPPAPPRVGAGSGVIISPDGYILTADHVVQQADRVTVTLHDRRQFEARVVARDPSTDVAVVHIEGNGLPVARLGRSEILELGDWVLAVGSPLGLEFTVTAGVVSAMGRAIGILPGPGPGEGRPAPLEHFIQTDAAINPGNSGGPLVNLKGEVVGLNTAIASPTGFFAGYGFAIPIDLARRVADDLIRHGFVRRGYLGVMLANVDQVDAQVYGLASPEGAHVIHVQQGGPAERAGVELGDVVVGIGGIDVATVSDLQAALAALEPGTTFPLRIVRYGRAMELPVQLGLVRTGIKPEPPPQVDGGVRLGFAVAPGTGGGLLVSTVQPYSRAARAGVRPGQVIVEVNRHQVSTVDELTTALGDQNHGAVSLIVQDPDIGRRIINFELRP